MGKKKGAGTLKLDESGEEIALESLQDLLNIDLSMEDNDIISIIELTIESIQNEMITVKNENMALYNTIKGMLDKILQNLGANIINSDYLNSLNKLFVTCSTLLNNVTDMNLDLYSKLETAKEGKEGKDTNTEKVATLNDINEMIRKDNQSTKKIIKKTIKNSKVV